MFVFNSYVIIGADYPFIFMIGRDHWLGRGGGGVSWTFTSGRLDDPIVDASTHENTDSSAR